MRHRGVATLIPTVLCCLPSLCGGSAFLANLALQRRVEDWGGVSSVSVALAVFIGWPLIVMAAVVSAVVGLSRSVSQEVKYAHYVVVGLATIATLALTFHFGIR